MKFQIFLFLGLLCIFKVRAECDGVCTAQYDPYCGSLSDGTTENFGNECEFIIKKDCHPNVYTTVRRGECGKAPEDPPKVFNSYDH